MGQGLVPIETTDDERTDTMFAYRTTWIIKEGRMQEALELVTRNTEQTKHMMTENVAVRVYTPNLSPNVLVYEDVFESEEEHDRLWAA